MLPPGEEDLAEGVVRTQAGEQPEVKDSLTECIGEVTSSEETDSFRQSGDQRSNSSSSSSSEVQPELAVQPTATEAKGSSTVAAQQDQADKQDGSTVSEVRARLVQAEVHASLENGENEVSRSSPSSEEKGDSERKDEDEENDDDGSRRDDYSEGDLVDISAYSGLGEDDSGGSQLDDEEDDEDDEVYQPETSCSEIPGLPEEEEPPPSNRKIQFSTAPIKVRPSYGHSRS